MKLLLFWNRKSSMEHSSRWQQECNGGRVDIISQILVKNEEVSQVKACAFVLVLSSLIFDILCCKIYIS